MEGSALPSPDELAEASRVLGMLAGQLAEYRDMLLAVGFRHGETQELVLAYQDHVLATGDGE